jgi:hypothetical protein
VPDGEKDGANYIQPIQQQLQASLLRKAERDSSKISKS